MRAVTDAAGRLAIKLPSNVWQCEFTAEELRHIEGTGRPLRAGDTIPVTETPVLVIHSPPKVGE